MFFSAIAPVLGIISDRMYDPKRTSLPWWPDYTHCTFHFAIYPDAETAVPNLGRDHWPVSSVLRMGSNPFGHPTDWHRQERIYRSWWPLCNLCTVILCDRPHEARRW